MRSRGTAGKLRLPVPSAASPLRRPLTSNVRAKVPNPTFPQFLVGSIAGACAGVWTRALGGLVLNGFFDGPHIKYFLLESLLVPRLTLYAFAAFVVIGSPIFLWARRRNKINLGLFSGIAALCGFLASHPATLIPSWALTYAFAGLVSGVVCYATMLALTRRSTRTRASAASRRSHGPVT